MNAVVRRLRAAGCVFAEDEARLLVQAASGPALERLVARRVAGEPLELVLGWADFCGIRVRTAPGVFVPRRRTGLLVGLATPLLHPGAVVVDLCCGTGALALALLRHEPDLEAHAADVDPAAVACARENLRGTGASVRQGDLDAALPPRLRGSVDVLVVNAPYVPSGEIARMPPEARDHEHHVALDGGADGLDVHRRVAALAPRWLSPGGTLLLETSERQAAATAAAVARNGLRARVVRDADAGATAVAAQRTG